MGGTKLHSSFVSIQDPATQTFAYVNQFGGLMVAESTRIVGGTFDGPSLNSTYWASTIVGSGAATQSAGLLSVATGTTANSSLRITSRKIGRYITNTGNEFVVGLLLNTLGDANNIKRWGCFDAANGFFFEQAAGALRLVIRKGGVDTAIASTALNGKNALIHDLVFHSYQIKWSGTRVQFFQNQKLLHSVSRVSALLVDTLHLRISFEVINSGGSTTNHSFQVANATINRLGKDKGRSLPYNLANIAETRTLKNTPGTLHKIIVGTRGSVGGNVIIYDGLNATGEKLVTLDTVNNAGAFDLDTDFSVGLTYVSSNNCGDILFVFD